MGGMAKERQAKRSGTAAALAVIMIFTFLVPNAAGGGPAQEARQADLAKSTGIRSLYSLLPDESSRRALDASIAFWSGQNTKVSLNEYVYTLVTHDMSGDRRPDLLAVRHIYGLPGTTDIRSQLIALEGATGDRLWTRTYQGATSFPTQARVGPSGKTGFIVTHISGSELMTNELVDTVRALNDRGRELWSREFHSTIVGHWPTQYVATNYVVGIDTFDGLPGSATDVLVGSGSVVALTFGSESGVIDAYVIDGATGELTRHAVPEVGFAGVPWLKAFGDFDRDGLDDYVFTSTRPAVEPADGDTPPQISPAGGVVTGRRGIDGEIFWSTVGFDFFEQNIFFTDRGNVTGDQTDDAFVETNPSQGAPEGARERTYLIDGRDGLLVWKRPGQWPFSPGDIDRDGKADQLLLSRWSADGYHATTVWALTIEGKKIWKRTYITKTPHARCCTWLWHFGGSWGVGDVDGDGLTDAYLDHYKGAFGSAEQEVFIVNPRHGALLALGDQSLVPLIRSINSDATADLALISGGIAGRMSVRVLEGETRNNLLTTELVFDPPADLKSLYIQVQTARLDSDECPEILLTVDTPSNRWEVVLDGGTGEIEWAVPFVRNDEVPPRVVGRSDRNTHC